MSTILVIDDDEAVCRAIQAVLSSHGFETVIAEDGIAGLNQFRNGRFDAVIVDIFMPVLDGIGTVREMRSLAPDVPLVVMSGHKLTQRLRGEPDFMAMAVKLGATCVLHKPFSGTELVATLTDALGLSESQPRADRLEVAPLASLARPHPPAAVGSHA